MKSTATVHSGPEKLASGTVNPRLVSSSREKLAHKSDGMCGESYLCASTFSTISQPHSTSAGLDLCKMAPIESIMKHDSYKAFECVGIIECKQQSVLVEVAVFTYP